VRAALKQWHFLFGTRRAEDCAPYLGVQGENFLKKSRLEFLHEKTFNIQHPTPNDVFSWMFEVEC
jgi:hypothetical protein